VLFNFVEHRNESGKEKGLLILKKDGDSGTDRASVKADYFRLHVT
jgi:hypothetical protein